jgi:hypothetical protein
LLEFGNPSPKSIGFAHGKELSEERSGAFAPCVNSFLVLVEPLFRLSHKGKAKQMELDSLRCDVLDDDGVAQFKELL